MGLGETLRGLGEKIGGPFRTATRLVGQARHDVLVNHQATGELQIQNGVYEILTDHRFNSLDFRRRINETSADFPQFLMN